MSLHLLDKMLTRKPVKKKKNQKNKIKIALFVSFIPHSDFSFEADWHTVKKKEKKKYRIQADTSNS